ncbi:hypothetical protein [Stenotrophomonas sp.]|uniref:hypothetical protein n=1 Tax=Stenotrophomonas sp. TaxID=69392 RepID=UPI002FC8534C
MPPGRVAIDGAEAVRNSIWAWLVRQQQGQSLTWDEADQALLARAGLLGQGGAGTRPRTLYRYFSTGQDPASLADGKLVDTVHGDPRFWVAKWAYEHPIWKISGPLQCTPEQLIDVRRTLMEQLGLHRPTVLERLVAAYHEVPGFSTYAPSQLDVVESMYNLVEGGCLDALGVCACNYLLALDCGRLEAAIGHREVLRWGVARFCTTRRLRKDASYAFSMLVEQRIIRRRHGALPAKLIGYPLGQAAQPLCCPDSEDNTSLTDDLPCMLPVAPCSNESHEFFAQFPAHRLKFADALALTDVVLPQLSEQERKELSFDGLNIADGLETLLDVPEDSCEAELAHLHQFKHINEAYAHLANFLPHPPNTRSRYSRVSTAAAMIVHRSG